MLAAWLVLGRATAALAAVAPRLSIDVNQTLECHDVTSTEFTAAHPDEKLLEARVTYSLRLEAGSEQDLDEVLVEVTSPERRVALSISHPRPNRPVTLPAKSKCATRPIPAPR